MAGPCPAGRRGRPRGRGRRRARGRRGAGPGGAALTLDADRVRQAALAAWAANPLRFREDANAEEDHARGWYRDRVVVELAQNAADAAAAVGEPGALTLRLTTGPEPTLVAVNTGAPLTSEGVASLASLRASAKRGAGAVGRFGVGFAAVRSVADEIGVVSTSGAVHFSASRAAVELAGLPALAEELALRGDRLPALRLPFAGPGPHPPAPPAGTTTAVVLRLRDDAAVEQVRSQLEALDDALLLALPALGTVTVDVDGAVRTLTDAADRWIVVRASGELPAEARAGLGAEERERAGWQLAWAVRRDGARPEQVHAPTPTDERCTVPALLVGTFPLDPGRRHVVPGPVTDLLVEQAGLLWPDLLLVCRRLRDGGGQAPDPLDLIPVGLPAGALDAALCEAVLTASRAAPVLPGPDGPVAPADATVLAPPWTSDVDAVRVLGRWFGSLVRLEDRHRRLVGPLRLQTVGLGELVEQLPADPTSLAQVYSLVGAAGPDQLAELGAAPVPLADGRVVHGARGLVLADGVPAAALAALQEWGLRVVHPAAAHPVLERLGAERVDAAALALHPLLRDRVLDGDEAASDVLLDLVAAAPSVTAPGWWSQVLLPAADGELEPARGLVLPGSPAAGWFDPEVLPPVDPRGRPADVLLRVGVRAGLLVERVDEVVAEELEGWQDYLDLTGAQDDGELLAVDLDAVLDWPGVLAALAAVPEVLAPGSTGAPSYTAWRLRHEPALGLRGPFLASAVRREATRGVLAHLPAAPEVLAGLPALQLALGGVVDVTDLTRADWADLLDDLEPGPVPLDLAVDCWRALAGFARSPGGLGELGDVDVVPAWDGRRARAVEVEDVAVCGPMHVQHPGALPAVLVPQGVVLRVATGLGVDTGEECVPGRVAGAGEPRAVPAAVTEVLDVPATWRHHTDLRVDGHPVAWWVVGDVLHATADGLAAGLAAVAGREHVARIATLLADPGARDEVLLDLAFGD